MVPSFPMRARISYQHAITLCRIDLYHLPMHIRQSPVDAVVSHRKLFMVDAHQMQHGGMHIILPVVTSLAAR